MIFSLKDWCYRVHSLAVVKGWWPGLIRRPTTADDLKEIIKETGEKLLMVHAEISEAVEELRTAKSYQDMREVRIGDGGKPVGFAIEIADAYIRLMDLVARLDIDIELAIEAKHQYNSTREYRHGDKGM